MNEEHGYKADSKINVHLNIGLVGCDHRDSFSIEGLTGLSQEDLDSMTGEQVEESINEAVSEWSYSYIDRGWSFEE